MPTESEKLVNEPPKERGWYWVQTNPAWGNEPEAVFLGYPPYDNELNVFSLGCQAMPLKEFCEKYPRRWMGRIKPPK